MKSESAAFLRKAHEAMDKAEWMLARWPDEAGRAAYLAGLHAAQALIFENTARVIKRHRGVQNELRRLTVSLFGFQLAYSERIYAAKVESRDFEARIRGAVPALKALIKEVTLGAPASG